MSEDDVKEGIEEHHVLKVTMAELAAMSPEDEEYDAKVTVLVERVQDLDRELSSD